MNGMVNQQRNDEGLRELALFAGAGGGILGGHLLKWKTVCAVEYNAYARSVLLARQNDGTLSPFPVWDDVRTFDGKPWRGLVDVVSGGFPCTSISAAGGGGGIAHGESALWKEQARIIREVEPNRVYVENSPMLTARGLGIVLGDLAAMGFDAEWGMLNGDFVGANHERERIWIKATHPHRAQRQRGSLSERVQKEYSNVSNTLWWENPPELHRMDDGMAYGLDRLKAIGNGQIPKVAATAWRLLA